MTKGRIDHDCGYAPFAKVRTTPRPLASSRTINAGRCLTRPCGLFFRNICDCFKVVRFDMRTHNQSGGKNGIYVNQGQGAVAIVSDNGVTQFSREMAFAPGRVPAAAHGDQACKQLGSRRYRPMLRRLPPARPCLQPRCHRSAPRRIGGAIDTFDASGAVQCMQAAAGPTAIGAQNRMHFLLKSFVVERDDLGQAYAGSVALRAVLHRAPQFPVAHDDGAGWPRRGRVDEYRIGRMGPPRPAQIGRVV